MRLIASLLTLSLSTIAYGQGLKGEYFAGLNFQKRVHTRTDPGIDFDWTYRAGKPRFVSPAPGVPGEGFTIRWTGSLTAPETGLYTFRMTYDDGMRVWIGGRRLLDDFVGNPKRTKTAQIRLQAGTAYSVRVEYLQVRWDSRVLLAWRPPSADPKTEPVPVPARALKPGVLRKPKPVSTPAVVDAAPVPEAAPVVVKPRPAPAPALSSLKPGVTLALPKLYFKQGTAELLAGAEPTLQELAARLKQNPGWRVEIAGHTDRAGREALNQVLSEQRAQVVCDRLIALGTDSSRVQARGYGSSRPVGADRDIRNRRVEVRVLAEARR